MLLRLFQTARQFNMEVQPQLVLLQKTLLAIEGLGRQLYPELDLWKTAKPVLEQWMRERHDPRTRFKQLVEAWPEISDDLALLPRCCIARCGAWTPRTRPRGACAARTVVVAEPRRTARLEQLVVGAALLIAGVLWSGLAEPDVARLGGRGALGLAVLVLRRGARHALPRAVTT